MAENLPPLIKCPCCFGQGAIVAPLPTFVGILDYQDVSLPKSPSQIPMECPICFGHGRIEEPHGWKSGASLPRL